jgi:hypothetical protein
VAMSMNATSAGTITGVSKAMTSCR